MSASLAFGIAVTIRVTLLLIVAGVIAAALRKRPAALHHALWTSAIIASLAVPVLTPTLSRLGLPASLPLRNVSSAFTWITNSIGRNGGIGTTGQHYRNAPGYSGTPAAIWDILSGGASHVRSSDRVGTGTLALWFTVMLMFLARLVAATVAVARLRRRARVVSDERILSTMDEIRGSSSSPVRLLESDDVTAPATAGIIRPIIFLPIDARTWNTTRLRATLGHEYAHIARRDCLTQLGADVARAIYWFNPLVWYARRRMIVERERACDDLVMVGGVRPDKYASVLIDTVRTSLAQRGTIALGVLSMARPSELETRLVSILDPARTHRGISRRASAMMAMSIAIGTILVAGSRVEGAQAIALLEPDLRGDSLTSPMSERLPLSEKAQRDARNPAALSGPDSVIARKLFAQLDRVPRAFDDLVRDRSTWALSIQRNGELVTPLLESLTDRDWRVRAYAAWALGEAHESRAVPLLLPLLREPNWRMRAMAGYALQAIGDPRAEEAMHFALGDVAWQVRTAAVYYFGDRRDPKYLADLEIALRDHHIAVRTAAESALRKLTNNS